MTSPRSAPAAISLRPARISDAPLFRSWRAEPSVRRHQPLRDIALLSAAAALIVAGKVGNLKDGVALGVRAIESGAAGAALDRLVAITGGRG